MVRGPLHGIARYALELATRLPLLERHWEFFGLVSPQGLPEDLGALTPKLPLRKCRADFLSPFEQPALWAVLQKEKPALFHATSFSVPYFWRGNLLATLHDANHLHLPHEYGWAQSAYYRLVVVPRIRHASTAITVSHFSKNELSKHLPVPRDQWAVIYQGVSDHFSPSPPVDIEAFRFKYHLPKTFLAVIGNPKKFKNLETLGRIEHRLPFPLVALAGNGAAVRLGTHTQVVELPALPEKEMPLLYSAAHAVLIPSRYEGFGLPALEAMACGTPVLASNQASLPEVIADAGLLVEANSPVAWSHAIEAVCVDEKLRQELVWKGFERIKAFSWQRCAEETLEVYRRALGQKPSPAE